MSRHRDEVYLLHIRDFAREAIEILGGASCEEVASQRLLYLALLHLTTLIGEATNRVSKEFQAMHPEIPWRDMVTMRNRLVHGYDTVEMDALWSTIKNDLPVLVQQLDAILGDEAGQGIDPDPD